MRSDSSLTGLSNFVFERLVASRGVRRRAWSLARQLLVQTMGDPICTMEVHGRAMNLRLSHALPQYLADHPLYDRLPGRLSGFLREGRSGLRCIDVGANVGDTIAALRRSGEDRFLAIEPNPRFFELLRQNWPAGTGVTCLPVLCSSSRGVVEVRFDERRGTASAAQTERGLRIERRTVDELVDTYCEGAVDLLKIDTDGHDFEVLRGARGVLARCQPGVLFECDAFGDPDYARECMSTLALFEGAGYRECLAYDNFGHILGRFSLSRHAELADLIFSQITRAHHYLDVLVMRDEQLDAFHRRELEHFVNTIQDEGRRLAAEGVARLALRDRGLRSGT